MYYILFIIIANIFVQNINIISIYNIFMRDIFQYLEANHLNKSIEYLICLWVYKAKKHDSLLHYLSVFSCNQT